MYTTYYNIFLSYTNPRHLFQDGGSIWYMCIKARKPAIKLENLAFYYFPELNMDRIY